MENITIEQILTISVISIWFAFPIGMLISFIKQSNEQIYPKVVISSDYRRHHRYPNHKHFGVDNIDVDEDDEDDFIDNEAPTIPTYLLPKHKNKTEHWKVWVNHVLKKYFITQTLT